MKQEDLQALNLEKDVIDKIMTLNQADEEAHKTFAPTSSAASTDKPCFYSLNQIIINRTSLFLQL